MNRDELEHSIRQRVSVDAGTIAKLCKLPSLEGPLAAFLPVLVERYIDAKLLELWKAMDPKPKHEAHETLADVAEFVWDQRMEPNAALLVVYNELREWWNALPAMIGTKRRYAWKPIYKGGEAINSAGELFFFTARALDFAYTTKNCSAVAWNVAEQSKSSAQQRNRRQRARERAARFRSKQK